MVLTFLEFAKEHPILNGVTVLFVHKVGDCSLDCSN